MPNTIQVIIKNVYGKDLVYPQNYKEEIRTLTGQKTLSTRQIEALQTLGIEIRQTYLDTLNSKTL